MDTTGKTFSPTPRRGSKKILKCGKFELRCLTIQWERNFDHYLKPLRYGEIHSGSALVCVTKLGIQRSQIIETQLYRCLVVLTSWIRPLPRKFLLAKNSFQIKKFVVFACRVYLSDFSREFA